MKLSLRLLKKQNQVDFRFKLPISKNFNLTFIKGAEKSMHDMELCKILKDDLLVLASFAEYLWGEFQVFCFLFPSDFFSSSAVRGYDLIMIRSGNVIKNQYFK